MPATEIPFVQLFGHSPAFGVLSKRELPFGMFKPAEHNPLAGATFDAEDWVCYPCQGGRDPDIHLLPQAVISAWATASPICWKWRMPLKLSGRKPDAILVFGVEPEILGNDETVYYEDQSQWRIVGIIGPVRDGSTILATSPRRMALTLHNLLQVDRVTLPIHGAMANIVLRDKHCANGGAPWGTAEPASRSPWSHWGSWLMSTYGI